VKKGIKKYCSFKAAVVLVILASFNLVTFGSDINDCLCKRKAEKKSCCTKKMESKCGDNKEADKKSCCKTGSKTTCPDCKFECNMNDNKKETAATENKNIKTEIKIYFSEHAMFKRIENTPKYFQLSQSPPGVRSKLFLDISTLII